MALSLVKTNNLGFFSLQGLGLKQLMMVNFEKTFIFVVSNLIKGIK